MKANIAYRKNYAEMLKIINEKTENYISLSVR